MQNTKQKMKLPLFLLMAVTLAFLTTGIVSATPDFTIDEIIVNDVDVLGTPNEHIVVEAGKTLLITVKLKTTVAPIFTGAEDVDIEAQIRGIETGTIEQETSLFDMKEDRTYVKYLTLKIPANFKFDNDVTDEFTLRIRASNDDNDLVENIDLTIDRPRHSVFLLDAQRPLNPINAGKTALIEVSLRNRGSKVEEDVFVKATIAELGTSRQKYLGDLSPLERPNSNTPDFDKHLSDKAVTYIRLEIPEGTVSGNYVVNVIAYSLDGIIRADDTVIVTVEGATTGSQTDSSESVVSVDSAFKTVGKGQGVVYKVIVSNIGNSAKVYTAQVAGVSFGTSRVDPAVLTLAPGANGEFNVFVSPAEASALGTYPFSVVVRAGSEEVTTLNLNTQVTEKASGSDRLRQNLIVIAVILVAILIVLAVIIAITTGRRQEDAEEKLY